jgi:hypothetical protein
LGGSLTFNDISYKKAYSVKKITRRHKQSVDDISKYIFNYKCDMSGLILDDPTNTLITIDPEIQGVVNCTYSFEDNLFKYTDKAIILNVMTNTIEVFNQLKKFIDMFCTELNGTICELKDL